MDHAMLRLVMLFLILEVISCSMTRINDFIETKKSIEESFDQLRISIQREWTDIRGLRLLEEGYFAALKTFRQSIIIATSLKDPGAFIDYMKRLLPENLGLFIFFWGHFYTLKDTVLYNSVGRYGEEYTMVIEISNKLVGKEKRRKTGIWLFISLCIIRTFKILQSDYKQKSQ
jgi:hypothetical protein